MYGHTKNMYTLIYIAISPLSTSWLSCLLYRCKKQKAATNLVLAILINLSKASSTALHSTFLTIGLFYSILHKKNLVCLTILSLCVQSIHSICLDIHCSPSRCVWMCFVGVCRPRVCVCVCVGAYKTHTHTHTYTLLHILWRLLRTAPFGAAVCFFILLVKIKKRWDDGWVSYDWFTIVLNAGRARNGGNEHLTLDRIPCTLSFNSK